MRLERSLHILKVLWHLHELRRNQWLKTSQIKKIQEKRLRAIVKYAYENVEFYHRRFDSLGLKPSAIKTTEDLEKVPITTRYDIQRAFPKEIVAKGVAIGKCVKRISSGSTGIPVTVASGPGTEAYRAALFGRPFFECGLNPRDKMFRFTATQQADKKWYEHLGLMRKKTVSPMQPIEDVCTLFAGYKPEAVFGHSSCIYLLARNLAQTKEEWGKPRLVFTTAELITRKMREFIDCEFDTKSFDVYGCVEVERLAWECREHAGLHIDIDSQVVEFVDGDENVSSGERGRILLTCLFNYEMPLIRYDVGDVGVPSDEACPCGRGLPLMKGLEGRISDFIKLPSGRIIAPMAFVCIDEIPGISWFRVIQEREDEIKIELMLDGREAYDTIKQVQDFVRGIVGDEAVVDIVTVREVTRDQSGKVRIVRSLMQNRLSTPV